LKKYLSQIDLMSMICDIKVSTATAFFMRISYMLVAVFLMFRILGVEVQSTDAQLFKVLQKTWYRPYFSIN
jgi:hypothetical protein